MLEPFFGSGSPGWTGVPAPALGWVQTPSRAPQGLAHFAASTAPSSTFPAAGLTFSPGGQPLGLSSVSPLYAYPSYALPDIITASALVAAIAVRRGQPQGPSNDQETEDFIFDALELLPGASDVEVRCEGGRVTLTGSVPHKRLKRDVGEIAWALGSVSDVQNNLTIATRRRSRSPIREADGPANVPSRKQA